MCLGLLCHYTWEGIKVCRTIDITDALDTIKFVHIATAGYAARSQFELILCK